jgi:hypothetical protein
MSHFSVNIANIVLTNEQYRKIRIYAEAHHISVHEAIRLLINSLPERPQTKNYLDKIPASILSRKFLQTFFKPQ